MIQMGGWACLLAFARIDSPLLPLRLLVDMKFFLVAVLGIYKHGWRSLIDGNN
jgi:hypothetical protein